MHPFRIGGIAAAVVIAIGAVLPWATVSSFFGNVTVSGVEGDGKLTLIGAIAVGVLMGLWKRGTVIAAIPVAGLVLLIGLIDLIDVSRAASELGGFASASPGIGLFVTLLGAIGAVVFAVIGLNVLRSQAPAGAAGAAPAATLSFGSGPSTALPGAGYAQPAQPGYAQPAQPGYAQPVQESAPVAPVAPAPPVAPTPQAVPAGWHPDPYGQAHLRYWDGTTWTGHTQ